jgi:tripartite-type tricarboxylate transporter receptor subunit TctC
MTVRRRTLLIALPCAVAAGTARAQGAAYPDKPIRFIVPSPPGGGTDTVTRLVADRIAQNTKWQFVVDNKPGAGGNIGMDALAKAAPDGYTFAMGESANLAINPYLYRKMPYDAEHDVLPVALAGTVPLVLVVPASGAYPSVAALAAAARQRQLTFASSGNGTVGHLVAEMWEKALPAKLVHVPYKGAAPVMTDLVGGLVDFHFASYPAALPLVQSGKLRALAVTSKRRHPGLPDVPTMIESGFPAFDWHVFYGVVAPAGTAPAMVARFNAEMQAALSDAALRKTLAGRGVEATAGPPELFAAFLAAERSKFARAVKVSGATVD